MSFINVTCVLSNCRAKVKILFEAYSRAVRRITEHFDCCPDKLSLEQTGTIFRRSGVFDREKRDPGSTATVYPGKAPQIQLEYPIQVQLVDEEQTAVKAELLKGAFHPF
jgi:hypothetical protein